MILVVIHELGHFLAARKAGIKVEEFGIGFPPRLWSWEWKKKGSGQWFKRNDVDDTGALKKSDSFIFSFNCLPIGGFCRVQGDESDSVTASKKKGKGDYASATFGEKSLFIFGGIIANFIATAVIFTVLVLFGMPRVFDNQFVIPSDTRETYGEVVVSGVVEGSPAEEIGLAFGDELLVIAGTDITRAYQVSQLTREYRGEQVDIFYRTEDGEYKSAVVQLNSEGESGFLGIGTFQDSSIRATWSAPIVGVGLTAQFTYETVKGLGDLMGGFFSGVFRQFSRDSEVREQGQADIKATGDGFAGPIGIVGVLLPNAVQSGIVWVLFLAAIISISLAVMNALPIPALDGGRWLLTAIFKAIRRPLTPGIESKINAIGFMFLIGLMILMTVLDIGRLGGN